MKIIRLYFKHINKILKILSIVFAITIVIIAILFVWHMYYYKQDFLRIISYRDLSNMLSIMLNKVYRIILVNWLITILSKTIYSGFGKGVIAAKKKMEENDK
ncbi:TRAP-type C4-dicarboxylate transport system permease small subunit [Breznakia pachnodae]|uniref:TRAP-type C4-dicarboxylate transport system permease small subunit n=1 Tax=Breznakia pachnodae TaxID=265178 RepID=A0ABU0DZD4_9FIRM|nr:TRAP-type C4-dicarboxylate transport system permease small subunit [Breznakia pachnodae]